MHTSPNRHFKLGSNSCMYNTQVDQNLTTQNLHFSSFSILYSIPLVQNQNPSKNHHSNSIYKLPRAFKLSMEPLVHLLKFDPSLDPPLGLNPQNSYFSFPFHIIVQGYLKKLIITSYHPMIPHRGHQGQLLATQVTTPKFTVLTSTDPKL